MTAPAKPSRSQIVGRKLVDRSIKRLNKPKTSPVFTPVPSSTAPLIPQFDPLSNSIPTPAYAQQVPSRVLPPAPDNHTATFPGPQPEKSAKPPFATQTPSTIRTTPEQPTGQPTPSIRDQMYYPPATLQKTPMSRTPRLPVDPRVDLGVPLHQFKDLVDLVIHAPQPS